MYRIRIKKAPGSQLAMGDFADGTDLQGISRMAQGGRVMGDQVGHGLYVAGLSTGSGAGSRGSGGRSQQLAGGNRVMGGFLPPVQLAQAGGVVDYFKQKMLDQYGKYLVTDKGANRTYYGYRGPDGKMIENNFEVLTGKTGDSDYYSPYSLEETEKKPQAFQDKIRVTPVGSFPLSVNANLYGSPGLNIENSNGLAMHATYNPEVRGAYYNNNNPLDNYASYGCINCRKPDIAAVMKGFGANDYINIVDSRKSVEDNLALARDNQYLVNHPEAARMLFENPKAHFVRRQWDADRGVYNGADSDYNPYTDTIVEKKQLAPVTVVGRRNQPKKTELVAQPVTSGDNMSVVDFLNSRGMDSSKVNRMNIAHDLGFKDYNYTAADNLHLLQLLEQGQRMEKGGSYSRESRVGSPASGVGSREPIGNGQWAMGNGGFYQAGGAVKDTLGPVDRSQANIEAELGETAVTNGRHFKIGGKPHSEEGTPLRVLDGTFIFSNTRKLKMGGPMLAEFGKSAETKKKFTPAQLAKQYDLNRYQDLIDDPDTDPLKRKTAQLMLQNNQLKLAKLALLQEAMKGFPQGIPSIALPLLQKMGVGAGSQESSVGSPQSGVGNQEPGVGGPLAAAQMGPLAGTPTVGGQEPGVSSQQFAMGNQGMGAPYSMGQGAFQQGQDDGSGQGEGMPMAQDGYWVQPHTGAEYQYPLNPTAPYHPPVVTPFVPSPAFWNVPPQQSFSFRDNPGGSGVAPTPPPVPARQSAGSRSTAVNATPAPNNQNGAPAASDIPSWFKLWTKSNTPQGGISINHRSTVYDPSEGNSLYDDYRYWSKVAGRPFKDAKDYQSFVYNQVRKGDWDSAMNMWNYYGLTNAGLANGNDPDWGFADGYFGARTAKLSHWRPQPTAPAPTTPAPDPTTPAPAPATPPKTDTSKKNDQTEPDWKTTPPDKTPWWTQDKINLGAAFLNRFDLRKYMPTLVSSDVVLPNSVYYDPARTLAAGQESAAMQNMMNTVYAGPQRMRAVGSNIQGQGFGLASNTLGDYANRNVAVGNQSATLRAGLLNQQNQFNRAALDNYLKGNTIANQQYDNSVRFMNNDIRRNWISGITNAEKTGWLNRLNPYFSLNPASGQLFFKQGKVLTDSAAGAGAGYGSDPLSMYNYYVQQYMDKVQGADQKSAREFALRAAFANKSQYGVDSDGDTRMSMSGAGYNPMTMMNMLGNYSQLPLSP